MLRRSDLLGLGFALVTAVATPLSKADASSKIQHVISPGGIEAYLITEPSIPFMSMTLRFDGGSVGDPNGKEGLAGLVSSLLDEGAGDLDSQAFQMELEDRAIHLTSGFGREYLNVSLRTLTEHRERAFEMLHLALTEPRFDDEPVARIKSQREASFRRRAQDPDYMASKAWLERAFAEHVFAQPFDGTTEGVEAVTAADLRDFVANRFARDNLLIGVAGDIEADELGRLLDKTLGDLPATAEPFSPTEIAPLENGVSVVRLDVPQSKVLFGQLGLKRGDPDFYAALIANHILGGGGFTSRLTSEIREARGLAYSVSSYLSPSDIAPTWRGGLGTSNETVTEAIDLVHAEVKRMAEGDVTQAELDDAKTYLTGSFPLRLTSNDRIAGLLVAIQLHDLGTGYLEERSGLIDAVTLDDVKRVAARLYDPENLLTVVVGDPADIEG